MIHNSKKVAVAMSGGIDSSVAAKILKDEGHDLVGLFLKLWSDPTSPPRYHSKQAGLRGASPKCKIKSENRCCNIEALEDARRVAQKLNIPFYVINAEEEFKKKVVDNFIDQYKKLKTPNPCIICNEEIKFGLMLKKALELRCNFLATGHYARIARTKELKNLKTKEQNGCHCEELAEKQSNENLLLTTDYSLLTASDLSKDQSYMLYRLNQFQLSHTLFPLGEMKKKEIRALAVKWDLAVKEKPESQEICFFGDKNYRQFLKRYLSKKYFLLGDIVDKAGNVLGRHQGLVNYTIGQRRGVTQELKNLETEEQGNKMIVIARIRQLAETKQSNDLRPQYVIGFNVKKNQLIVGEDRDVYKKGMVVSNINWIMPNDKCQMPNKMSNIKVKIRYRHEAVGCKVKIDETTPHSINRLRGARRLDTDYKCHSESASASRRMGDEESRDPSLHSRQRRADRMTKNCEAIKVIFDEPQRAITPGQSAVFYLGDMVLGGGVIVE